MVISCSAYGCTNRFVKNSNIKYHRFPCDPQLRKKWIIALKRKDFEPSKTAVICSTHFSANDYEVNVHGNIILKKGSIPTNFKFSRHRRKSLPRRVIVHTSNTESGNEIEEVHNVKIEETQNTRFQAPVEELVVEASSSQCIQKKNFNERKRKKTEPRYFRDFEAQHLKDPIKRKKYWLTSQKVVKTLKHKVKYFETKTIKMKNKIKMLLNLVDHLTNEKKIRISCSSLLKAHRYAPAGGAPQDLVEADRLPIA